MYTDRSMYQKTDASLQGYLGTMIPLASLVIFIACGLGGTLGNRHTELGRCITRGGSDSNLYGSQFCWLTKHDENIACPGNQKIVLVSIHFPLKESIDECTKRILNSRDSFCCKYRNDDVVYDGECLQNIWNSEDRQHYRKFMNIALQKCSYKKDCLLPGDMFENLQRELPQTRKFSSYLQINHQCIKEATDIIEMCSAKSVNGRDIYIQDNLVSTGPINETCTCNVYSEGNGKVTVRAFDVRTAHSGLILRSGNMIKDLSHSQQPLFGLKEMVTERELDITIVKGLHNSDDNLWLQLSGSNGQDVNIVCRGPQYTTSTKPTEATTHAITTSPLPDRETPVVQEVVADQQDDLLEDYWPMIYLGAGSGITIVLVVCVVGGILICRYSMMKEKGKGQYGNPYRHSQVNYNRSGQYDTVLDDMQHIPGHMVASNQETLEWR